MPTVDFVVYFGDLLLGIVENPSGNQGGLQFTNSLYNRNGQPIVIEGYETVPGVLRALENHLPPAAHSLVEVFRRENGKIEGKLER